MKFSPEQKHVLYAELGKLLRAGFPVEKALEVLREQKLPQAHLVFIDTVQRGIDEGLSISEAVNLVGPAIGDLEKALIAAGERGGKLADVFRHLGEYFHRLAIAKKAILTQLIYPVSLFHVAVILAALPRLFRYGWSKETWLPMVAALGIFYVCAAILVAAYETFQFRAAHDAKLDRFFSWIPLFGSVRRAMSLERYCKVFQIYMLAGIRPSRAVVAAGDASQSGALRESSHEMSHQIELGLSLGPLYRLDPVYPQDFALSMAIAEEAGTMDTELGRWSKMFAFQGEEALERLKIWLPRLIYLLIVLYVAWLILSIGTQQIGMYNEFFEE